MKHKKINLSKCRVIFFDLEFYVPKEGRNKKGFCYNPWEEEHLLIGGEFRSANPKTELSGIKAERRPKPKSFWIWDHESEKALLQNIYSFLKTTCDLVRKPHDGRVAPVLCGIGISSSDIPIIFELFKRHNILGPAEAFEFQNLFRIVDLSQLSIATFKHSNDFLYPKVKSEILSKYLPGKKFESGKTVWDCYDSNDYSGIQSRVTDEVQCTVECYIKILSNIRKFKILEEYEKKRLKSIEKAAREEREVKTGTGLESGLTQNLSIPTLLP